MTGSAQSVHGAVTPATAVPVVGCELAVHTDWQPRLHWLLENLAAFAGVRLDFEAKGIPGSGRRLVIGGSPDRLGPQDRILWLPFDGDAPGTRSRDAGRIPVYGPRPDPDDPAGLRLNPTLGHTPFPMEDPGPGCLRLAWDVLGPAFHELARTVELDPTLQSAFHDGRSLAVQAESPSPAAPWLEGLAERLFGPVTCGADGPPALPRWPGPHCWALCLSHDVDMLFKWRLRRVIRLLLESPLHALSGRMTLVARQWRELARRLATGEDPWWQVEEMLDLEERHGAVSSFLFLAESHDHRTYRYLLGRAAVRALLQRLRQRGADLQLHGGWFSLARPDILARERQRFAECAGVPPTVIRQHYLRFRRERTWADHETAGFRTDSTLGWNDRPGFRAGTSLPFFPWNPQTGAAHALLEIPLGLMDSQFYFERELVPQAARHTIGSMVDTLAGMGGLLCVNWHPHVLCREDYPGLADLYSGLLEEALARNPWCVTLAGLDSAWRDRERVRSSEVRP